MIWDESSNGKTRDNTPGTISITVRGTRNPLYIYGNDNDYIVMYNNWVRVATDSEKFDFSLIITHANGNVECILWKDVCHLAYLANDR